MCIESIEALKVHEDIKHKFMCSVCGGIYKTNAILRDHVAKIHERVPLQSFPCNFQGFGKVFARKQHLEGHINAKHCDSKPYKCLKCPKRYASQTGLARHLKSCATMRKITCKQCQKEFGSKSELKDYEDSAHHQKKFTCACGKTFSWRSGSLRHKKASGC